MRLGVFLSVFEVLLRRCGFLKTAKMIFTLPVTMKKLGFTDAIKSTSDVSYYLTLQQAAPALALYHVLKNACPDIAEEVFEEAVVKGTLRFLNWALREMKDLAFFNLSLRELETAAVRVGERFFNATIEWKKITPDRLEFSVKRCIFVDICRRAGLENVSYVFCLGDGVFFDERLEHIKLDRPKLLSNQDDECVFVFFRRKNEA